jgi:hypothetical protein
VVARSAALLGLNSRVSANQKELRYCLQKTGNVVIVFLLAGSKEGGAKRMRFGQLEHTRDGRPGFYLDSP